MEAIVPFGGGGITVWVGWMRNGKTELVIIIGQSMNAVTYRDLCLNETEISFAKKFVDGFIMIDYNARRHRS